MTETVPDAAGHSIAAWLTTASALLADRDAAQWRLSDWIACGRQLYGAGGGTVPVAAHLRFTPHKLRAMTKVSTAFPPERRDPHLPFDVHAHLAGMSDDERTAALARASAEGWGEREAKAAVVAHRQATAMFEDEDEETRRAVEIMRAWNRAMPEAREYFMELAREAGSAAIDDDVAHG